MEMQLVIVPIKSPQAEVKPDQVQGEGPLATRFGSPEDFLDHATILCDLTHC